VTTYQGCTVVDNKKWFVASYIRTVESFDNDLLKRIIEVGIHTSDLSYNRFFYQIMCANFWLFKSNKTLDDE
jgi:hypothetical protein